MKVMRLVMIQHHIHTAALFMQLVATFDLVSFRLALEAHGQV